MPWNLFLTFVVWRWWILMPCTSSDILWNISTSTGHTGQKCGAGIHGLQSGLSSFYKTLVSLLTFRLAPPERWRGFLSEIPKGLIQTKSSVCHYMWNISLHSMCSWSFMLLVWSAKLFWLHILPPQVALFFFFRFHLVTLCSAPPQASHAE